MTVAYDPRPEWATDDALARDRAERTSTMTGLTYTERRIQASVIANDVASTGRTLDYPTFAECARARYPAITTNGVDGLWRLLITNPAIRPRVSLVNLGQAMWPLAPVTEPVVAVGDADPNPAERQTAGTHEVCGAGYEDTGFACTRPHGHQGGQHVAGDSSVVHRVWQG